MEKSKKDEKPLFNYYDTAPEHNELINHKGLRNLIIFVILLCACIVMFFWLYFGNS